MSYCSRFRRRRFTVLDFKSWAYNLIYGHFQPYFYFRFVWPTYLESIPHASTITLIIPTKFEVGMCINCRVIAFLSADTSHDLDLLTLNSSCAPSLKPLRVITFPIGYHWKCVCGHCACAESRDPWVGGQKQLHFGNPRPQFAYSLCNFYWATKTIKGRLLLSVINAKAVDCVNFLCWLCDLEQLSYMAGHVTNPGIKFEDPKTIRSWVTEL